MWGSDRQGEVKVLATITEPVSYLELIQSHSSALLLKLLCAQLLADQSVRQQSTYK